MAMTAANLIPFRMTVQAAVRIIKQRATSSGNVILTYHAQERMEERGINLDDVLTILRKGSVYAAPRKNDLGDWQAEMERRMPGGRDVVAVTVIPLGDRLVVKTVMWRDER
jgi:hypothetical protein